MSLYPGDPVTFFAAWSTWRGMRGRVVKNGSGLWVLIDGDAKPVAVNPSEVVREESKHHMTAGD